MVRYLCGRICDRNFMLIFLNLYSLHFNLTSLLGKSCQAPLQIFIGPIAGQEIMLDIHTSILTASSPCCHRECGSQADAGNLAPQTHKEVFAIRSNWWNGRMLGNALEFLISWHRQELVFRLGSVTNIWLGAIFSSSWWGVSYGPWAMRSVCYGGHSPWLPGTSSLVKGPNCKH